MTATFKNINKQFMSQGNIPFAQVGIAKWYNALRYRSGCKS